jgi:hypothetical protein
VKIKSRILQNLHMQENIIARHAELTEGVYNDYQKKCFDFRS